MQCVIKRPHNDIGRFSSHHKTFTDKRDIFDTRLDIFDTRLKNIGIKFQGNTTLTIWPQTTVQTFPFKQKQFRLVSRGGAVGTVGIEDMHND